MLEQCLPGACGSHISKQAIGLLVDYVHRSVCWIYNAFWLYLFKFFVVLVYLTGTELIDQERKIVNGPAVVHGQMFKFTQERE